MQKKELKEQYKRYKPDMGVFVYLCKATGKAYVGMGQNMKADMNSITFQLNVGNFLYNANLQSDWKKHGEAGFERIVAEVLSYDKDETKTDYSEDLLLLRELVAERYSEKEYIR